MNTKQDPRNVTEGTGEEVQETRLWTMIGQEGAPGLRGGLRWRTMYLANRGLRER